jgi:hypothetical protein
MHSNSSCSTNTQVHDTYVNGSVDMTNNPLTPFDASMVSPFNLTAGEDWSFEGVADDGQAGMAITFSRGTVAKSPLAQRILLAVTWPNGTRYLNNTFADVSTITACKDSTVGTWYDGASGMNWTFEASNDYSYTHVTIDSAEVKGTYTLNALSPAIYPNGLKYPNADGNPLFAPYLYWVENTPVGVVHANLTINGTPFIINGIGGRERNWNSYGWANISSSWNMARAAVGPYTLIAWKYLSKVDNATYFSSVVMEGKEVVFRTQSQEMSSIRDYGSFNWATNGTVHLSAEGLPNSTFTGFSLDMVSPQTGKHWKFDIDFTKTVYWFKAGSASVIGGFVGSIRGGEVGGKQYAGLASGNAQEKFQF